MYDYVSRFDTCRDGWKFFRKDSTGRRSSAISGHRQTFEANIKRALHPLAIIRNPRRHENLRFVRASIPRRGELLKSRLRRERSFAKIPLAATKQNQRTLRLLIGIICSRRAFHPFAPDRPFSFRAEEKIPAITSA